MTSEEITDQFIQENLGIHIDRTSADELINRTRLIENDIKVKLYLPKIA